jgi:hypothetical protein
MTEETQAAPEAAPVEAPRWAAETEQEAKALGWKAPDEWKGDIPPGYIDNPEKYLERAESFTPFRKLKEKLHETESKFDQRFSKLEAVSARALERKIAEIQTAKLAAVETGDVEGYKALEQQQANLAREAEAPSAVPNDHKTAIDRWAVGKGWFKTDKVMTQAAVVLYGEAQEKGITDPTAILSYVDDQMGKKFRIEGEPVVKHMNQAVSPGLTFGAPAGADPFSKLPADAKKDFARFVAKGWFTDDKAGRAAYAEDYNAA